MCAYDAGGFLETAVPTDGRSSKRVFKEWVSSKSYVPAQKEMEGKQ